MSKSITSWPNKNITLFFSVRLELCQDLKKFISRKDLRVERGYQARAKRGGPKGPRARARALANFTPIHHWEGGELK